jgi:hypothetical protein
VPSLRELSTKLTEGVVICGQNNISEAERKNQSHDHHFKWWFDIGPIRAIILAHLKGGHRKHITGNL